jgi:polar amino acid transport system substrate-binding protein
MTGFYLPKQEPELEKAITAQIRAMDASGEMRKLIEKYGGDPTEFLRPAPDMADYRRGVDRAADWQPPSM